MVFFFFFRMQKGGGGGWAWVDLLVKTVLYTHAYRIIPVCTPVFVAVQGCKYGAYHIYGSIGTSLYAVQVAEEGVTRWGHFLFL